jgi:hypothetical protein
MYALMIGFSIFVLFFSGFTARFFEEVYFIISPLITLFLVLQITDREALRKHLDIIFYLLIAANLIYTGLQFFDFFQSKTSLTEELVSSTSATESPFAFDFGLFTVYYFLDGKKKNTILAFLFAFVAFKRIVLLGLLVAYGCYFFYKKIRSKAPARSFLTIVTIANIVLVVNIYLFSSGKYDKIVEQLLNVSANYISQGRYVLYQGIFDLVQNNTFFHGLGLGTITHYLVSEEAFLSNLHSDLLKVFLEFGIFLYIFWVYNFYKKTYNRIFLLVVSVFMNILFITDNVFVYYDVMLFYYLFIVLLFENKLTQPTQNGK